MNFKIFSIYVFRSQFQVEISCLRQQKEVEGIFNKDKVSICRAISTDVKIKELLTLKCLVSLVFGSVLNIWSPGQ